MSPRVLLRLGVRSLFLHKLRSSLSILGVVFGVSAVVAMSSVGEGARRESLQQIGALGIDSITVRARPGEGVPEARAWPRGKPGPIRTRDVNRAVFVPLPALDRGHDPRPDGVDEIVMRVDEARHVGPSAEVVKSLLQRTTGGSAFEVIVP